MTHEKSNAEAVASAANSIHAANGGPMLVAKETDRALVHRLLAMSKTIRDLQSQVEGIRTMSLFGLSLVHDMSVEDLDMAANSLEETGSDNSALRQAVDNLHHHRDDIIKQQTNQAALFEQGLAEVSLLAESMQARVNEMGMNALQGAGSTEHRQHELHQTADAVNDAARYEQ
jgi:hypothetical protein